MVILILPDLIVKLNFVSGDSSEYLIYISDGKNYIFDDDLELNLYLRNIEDNLDNKYYFKLVEREITEDKLMDKLNNGDIDGYINVISKNTINIFTRRIILKSNLYWIDIF